MEPTYHVPRHQAPYRRRIIIRIAIALVGGCIPMVLMIGEELYFYLQNMARGDTFEHYRSLRPTLWSMPLLCFALGCLFVGIRRDGWLLVKRLGTSTVIPIPYWLALVFVVMAVVVYLLNVRLP